MLIAEFLRQGRHHAWNFQPFTDAGASYMRTHLDLDDLEAMTRFPRRNE